MLPTPDVMVFVIVIKVIIIMIFHDDNHNDNYHDHDNHDGITSAPLPPAQKQHVCPYNR